MPEPTSNPCIDICKFNKRDICKACGRTKQEKKNWKRFGDDERRAIWRRILETHGRGDKKKARRLRERYEKARAASK